MTKKHTYKCNKCGNELLLNNLNENVLCFRLAPNGISGLCLGSYRAIPSNDTKQVREFFHVIANYIKLKRILSIFILIILLGCENDTYHKAAIQVGTRSEKGFIVEYINNGSYITIYDTSYYFCDTMLIKNGDNLYIKAIADSNVFIGIYVEIIGEYRGYIGKEGIKQVIIDEILNIE